ncbi:hypothetical protein [Flavobacterium sp.]|uniref:hypothetical protein n=1 Tax=Flavobacterium sp. TaxID=239 RepID=UPI004047D33E
MKIYYFITAIAVCAFFVSCSNDDTILTKTKSFDVEYSDNNNLYKVQNDSLGAGEPIPPKSKDE